MTIEQILAIYNNDYDQINFIKKGEEEIIRYNELIEKYELAKLIITEFGIDTLGDLYIKFKELEWSIL